RILHQVRAGSRLRHLADGAAEVHVDDVRARRLDHPRRLRHRRGLGAEDLDRERMLVGGDAQVAERPLVPVLDPGGGHHLRADEPRAETPALAAERLDRDAGHRREHEPRRHLDVADRPRFLQIHGHGFDRNRVRLTVVDAGGTIRPRRGAVRQRLFLCRGQEDIGEGSHPHAGGAQEAPGGDRGIVHNAASRGRGADPHRARVRRHRGERRVRLGEERPGSSRGAHRNARGAARELPRRDEEGDPVGRGLRRDEGAAEGHVLEQAVRVPHRRLGRGEPGGDEALERVARREGDHGSQEGRRRRGLGAAWRAQVQDHGDQGGLTEPLRGVRRHAVTVGREMRRVPFASLAVVASLAAPAAAAAGWSKPAVLVPPGKLAYQATLATAADGTTIVVWDQYDSGKNTYSLLAATRTPQGKVSRRTLGPAANAVAKPALAVGGDGTFAVAWEYPGKGTGGDSLAVRIVRPGESTFEPASTVSPANMSTDYGAGDGPSVAVDDAGTVYVTWEGVYSGRGGKHDEVVVTDRADGARTWSPVVRLSSPAADSHGARVAAAGKGHAAVSWAETNSSVWTSIASAGRFGPAKLISGATYESSPASIA